MHGFTVHVSAHDVELNPVHLTLQDPYPRGHHWMLVRTQKRQVPIHHSVFRVELGKRKDIHVMHSCTVSLGSMSCHCPCIKRIILSLRPPCAARPERGQSQRHCSLDLLWLHQRHLSSQSSSACNLRGRGCSGASQWVRRRRGQESLSCFSLRWSAHRTLVGERRRKLSAGSWSFVRASGSALGDPVSC